MYSTCRKIYTKKRNLQDGRRRRRRRRMKRRPDRSVLSKASRLLVLVCVVTGGDSDCARSGGPTRPLCAAQSARSLSSSGSSR